MRLGLKAVLAMALATALVVPAASAKSEHAPSDRGGKPATAGPPTWAQSGGSESHGGGKPDWAGQTKPDKAGQTKPDKADKAERTLERSAAKAAKAAQKAAAKSDEDAEEGPLHDNPAFVCKFAREMMTASGFAEKYGTDENDANAFGKCVSQEAHERGGVSGGGEAPPESCEASEIKRPADESTGEDATEDESAESDEPVTEETGEVSDEPAGDECADEGSTSDDGEASGQGESASEGDEGSSEVQAVLGALRRIF
jgi:hypothetical protein